ncbi:ISPsy3, transposase [Pseudomonas syringae pv. actinidiae ICMP 18801]|nr:ISPsy3, transposase [Pseudomonas syringae pv. actinidiae ICMP 18801]
MIIMKPAYPPLLLQMSPAYTPRPLKNLFTANQCWAHLIEEGGLRDIEVESVTKMLACGTSILGVKHYTCGNDSCSHVKYLCNTCSCRACPSCGKKANCNDLQSKWPRPAIIAFFDRDRLRLSEPANRDYLIICK